MLIKKPNLKKPETPQQSTVEAVKVNVSSTSELIRKVSLRTQLKLGITVDESNLTVTQKRQCKEPGINPEDETGKILKS